MNGMPFEHSQILMIEVNDFEIVIEIAVNWLGLIVLNIVQILSTRPK